MRHGLLLEPPQIKLLLVGATSSAGVAIREHSIGKLLSTGKHVHHHGSLLLHQTASIHTQVHCHDLRREHHSGAQQW